MRPNLFRFMRYLFLAAVPVLAPFVGGQEIEVEVTTESPPLYVGKGAVVQLTVNGFEARPDPLCVVLTKSPAIRTQLLRVDPRIMQQVYSSGGTIRRIQSVTHTIQLRVIASEPGEYEIGPFVLSQNGKEKRVDPIKMSFQDVPTTDDMRIRLRMPETAYPDQRVPVVFEWWFAGSTDDLNSIDITSPLPGDFNFAPDDSPTQDQVRIPVHTSQGTIGLAADARRETVDGKEFTVFTAERTMIPDRPGEYEIPSITATVEVVTQWQSRGSRIGLGGSLLDEAFGPRRRPAKVEMFRAEGEPIRFQVKPFPQQNRPESFSGAVGSGFSLDVSADRSVVRVGDPIRLTLKLRGDGNIEGAALPSLSADGGLDPGRFRLPEGAAAGEFDSDQGTKQFAVSIRVLDESVNEVPAIAYSWFDPEREAYQTVRSAPIALRVTPATMIGADAVVSNTPRSVDISTTADRENRRDDVTMPLSTFSLSGADLAIVENPSRLLGRSDGRWTRNAFRLSGYAAGTLCLLFAVVDRKRREVNPQQARERDVLRTQRDKIEQAGKLDEKRAAKQTAEALQTILAEIPTVVRADVAAVIAECEKVAYRPTESSATGANRDWNHRALQLLDAQLQSRGRG